ncbi:type IV pilus assembly protein PilA [Neobacillus niacini]|uniref:prepilin-type N-terminal cleavage/methylation domain-containing protein n=1 Tax=Neobacillus driksii TaxID=3035913 RepID=UPI0027882E0C|nr:prepilin-type N-terminal cleavage/methylation domain-containing protein [Neobacillus niacini]MDQ0975665.1 type IV pilus assembly protein PilA [Neobacillus niacini]
MLKKIGSRLKEQKGFTLIELLAVIVILGIIAAIAIPAIGNVISKSDDKAKVQEALLIIDAAKMFVADNHPSGATTTLTKDTTTADAAETATLPTNGLTDYLDRVDDSSFSVTVTKTATGYTYAISGHAANEVGEAADIPDSASEDDLLGYN